MKKTRFGALLLVVLPSTIPATAENLPASLCRLVLHEETVELEDARLETELARSSLASFDEIYRLIESLSKSDAIDRMTYLRARHDRDAAKLRLERGDLLLARQEALLEQYRLACDDGEGQEPAGRLRTVREAHLRYIAADCDQQAKAIEAAEVELIFNREWLASIQKLRAQVATAQDVILAALDVEQEEKKIADAKRREESCRTELARLESE